MTVCQHEAAIRYFDRGIEYEACGDCVSTFLRFDGGRAPILTVFDGDEYDMVVAP